MATDYRRIRVLLIDDHSVMRDGLRLVLEGSGEFEVVGQARDGEEAVRAAADLSTDVVMMDVLMPNKDGVEACREIMESAPDTRVIMLTASSEEDAVIDAVAAGATGYLQKVSAICSACSGSLGSSTRTSSRWSAKLRVLRPKS